MRRRNQSRDSNTSPPWSPQLHLSCELPNTGSTPLAGHTEMKGLSLRSLFSRISGWMALKREIWYRGHRLGPVSLSSLFKKQ
ncbi:hypothetical protein VUR80DRAFT_1276 [Thermomyces stellatus]